MPRETEEQTFLRLAAEARREARREQQGDLERRRKRKQERRQGREEAAKHRYEEEKEEEEVAETPERQRGGVAGNVGGRGRGTIMVKPRKKAVRSRLPVGRDSGDEAVPVVGGIDFGGSSPLRRDAAETDQIHTQPSPQAEHAEAMGDHAESGGDASPFTHTRLYDESRKVDMGPTREACGTVIAKAASEPFWGSAEWERAWHRAAAGEEWDDDDNDEIAGWMNAVALRPASVQGQY